jgi:16S rRNA U1498 N3-methylase RsmE
VAILLYHEHKDDGQIAIAEGKVAGEHTPARRYKHKGHFVNIDGPDHVLHHDIEQLKQLGYRLATAEDQERHAKQQKSITSLKETK